MTIIRAAAACHMDEIMTLVDHVFESEQSIPRELNPISAEKNPQWWCVTDHGKVIGAIAAWQEKGKTHMGRFAIVKEYRRQHLGTSLARFALDELFQQDVQAVHMKAREETVRIMVRLGGQVTGEPIPFYSGTVTPLILEKKNYKRSD